jgi:hypothetical protein
MQGTSALQPNPAPKARLHSNPAPKARLHSNNPAPKARLHSNPAPQGTSALQPRPPRHVRTSFTHTHANFPINSCKALSSSPAGTSAVRLSFALTFGFKASACRIKRSMQALGPRHWAAIFAKTDNSDAETFSQAVGSPAVLAGRALWHRQALMQACFAILIEREGASPLVRLVQPTTDGYTIEGTLVPRRMFVHAFPRLVGGGAPGLRRVTACMAFQPEVARTLPSERMHPWRGLVVCSDLGPMTMRSRDAAAWPTLLLALAACIVARRVGPPTRQRGRRRRNWTKVSPAERDQWLADLHPDGHNSQSGHGPWLEGNCPPNRPSCGSDETLPQCPRAGARS